MVELLDSSAQAIVACSRCATSPLRFTDSSVTCPNCGWTMSRSGRILSDAASTLDGTFDDKFGVLEDHNHHAVVWDLCYRRQCTQITEAINAHLARLASSSAEPVVLDIGCGPHLPYQRPQGAYLVGVEPSLPALRVNHEVDLALHASASSLPLANDTVDVVVSIYAIHHMIGDSVKESWTRVASAFEEIGRVAKPGATIVMLEICPWPGVWLAERLGWKAVHRVWGDGVDMVFWPTKTLERQGASVFPGATLQRETFSVSPLATFPPVIAVPKFKIPRVLYPFSVCMFTWTLAR